MKFPPVAKAMSALGILFVVTALGFQNCEHAVQGSRAFVQNSYGSSPICGIDETDHLSCYSQDSRYRADDRFQPQDLPGQIANAYDAQLVGNARAEEITTGYSCVLSGNASKAANGSTVNSGDYLQCYDGRAGRSELAYSNRFKQAVSQITTYSNLDPLHRHTCVLLKDGTVDCWQARNAGDLREITGLPAGIQEIAVYEAPLLNNPVRPYLVARNAASVYIIGLDAPGAKPFNLNLQSLLDPKLFSLAGASHLRSHQVPLTGSADIFYGLDANGRPFVVTPFDQLPSVGPFRGQQQLNATSLGTNLQKIALAETHGCGLVGGNVVCYSSDLNGTLPTQAHNPALAGHLYSVKLPAVEVGKIVDIEVNDTDVCAATAARNVYCWQGVDQPAGAKVEAVLRHQSSPDLATPTPSPTATPVSHPKELP